MMESNGLIGAFLLDGQGGGRKLDWAGIRAWQPGDGVIWIHLNYVGSEAKTWLTDESGLEYLISSSMLDEDSRPRCMPVDGALLVNLRGVNLNPGADPEDMVSVRIWVETNRIITVRKRKLLALQDIENELMQGIGPENTGQFLAELIQKLADRIETVIDGLSDIVDDLEENIPTENIAKLRMLLSETRRQLISLRRYLSPQQDVLRQLVHVEKDWLSLEERDHIRESAETTIRHVEEMHSFRDRTSVAQDEFRNRVSEEMNRTMFRLTLLATIMMPLTLFTGLLGINVAGIPYADKHWAFGVVSAFLVIFICLELLVLRWLK